MARWLVQIIGKDFDLEEFPRSFPDGGVHAIEENGEFYLVGSEFETLTESNNVLKLAKSKLELFTAVISLESLPSLRGPKLGNVIKENDDGTRSVFVSVTDSIGMRSKARGTLTVSGATEAPPSKTQAQNILERAKGKPHLEAALQLWADRDALSWPRLYRILEEIENHLEKNTDKADLCSNNERERFMRSANSAEASGKDARHAAGKFQPPVNPMNKKEANRFIRRVLLACLSTIWLNNCLF